MTTTIYLIANNGFLQTSHIQRLHIDYENDIVVLFNYMCVPYDTLQPVKRKIAFLRTVYTPHEANNHYLGGVEFLSRQHDFEKVICVDDPQKYSEYTQHIQIPHEILITDTFLNKIQFLLYTNSKTPTTGFLAYLFMKQMYPQCNIVLVGFTGHYADGSQPDDLHHDYNLEQQYYQTHHVERMYTSLSQLTSNDLTAI